MIEFVEKVSKKLESGVVLSMGEIDAIKEQHGVGRSRWRIKEILCTMVTGVELTTPKNSREPKLAEARKEALTVQRTIEDFKLATLLKAAKILREETPKEPHWIFEGDIANFNPPPCREFRDLGRWWYWKKQPVNGERSLDHRTSPHDKHLDHKTSSDNHSSLPNPRHSSPGSDGAGHSLGDAE